MQRPLIVLLPALFAAPLLAQKIELKAKAQDHAQQFRITTKLTTSDSRKTLINGEESAAGGGRGGRAGAGGERSLSQQVEFVEGPAGAWRQYTKLAASQSRPGRDGEARETAVEGALQGKKVFIKTASGEGVTLSEGQGEKAEVLDAALSRGVPAKVSLAGFLPGKAVAAGEAFELAGFADALRGLVHPVTPERTQGAGGARDQGGGQGQGGRGQGGRRAGGQRGRFRAGSTVIELISAGKLASDVQGKLIGVEEKDGQKIASIEITGKLSGKGKSPDFGLRAGARGGRGGQAANAGSDDLDAGIEIKGKVTFDTDNQRVLGVEIACQLKIERQTKRTMSGRDGEDRTIESTTKTSGKLQLLASCQPAGK